MNTIKLGLVGLGKQGREHLSATLDCDDIKIACGYDPSDEAFDKALALNSDLQRLSKISDFSHFKLDGLILALPHFVYDTLWPELLELKLPMLKEKPLGRNVEEAMRFLAQAKANHCPVQTAIQRRYHPSYQHLKSLIESNNLNITEATATLHLGFPRIRQPQTWRDEKRLAGGGALLDAGYHMIDLLHFFIGSFDTVSASMWRDKTLCQSNDIDDQVLLLGRNSRTWIAMDAQVHSNQKKELISLVTNHGYFEANRSGVWHDDRQVFTAEKQWNQAMQEQIRLFGNNIRHNSWHDPLIWDQIPAMQVIEDAYRVAMRG